MRKHRYFVILVILLCSIADLKGVNQPSFRYLPRCHPISDVKALPTLCGPGTNLGLLILGLFYILAVTLEPQCAEATVGSKRKNPSSAKQKSPATKRSWKGFKEGEPEPPMLPEEIMEPLAISRMQCKEDASSSVGWLKMPGWKPALQDPRGVMEMLLMMAGDVEPNPGPNIWVQVQGVGQPMEIEVSSGASVSKIVQITLPGTMKWMSKVDAKSKDNIIPVSRTVETLLEEDIGTSAECPLLLIEPEEIKKRKRARLDEPEELPKPKKAKLDKRKEQQTLIQDALKLLKVGKVKPYVERECANTAEMLQKMAKVDCSVPVLFFIGPSGSGKSTTLKKLYRKYRKKENSHAVYIDVSLCAQPQLEAMKTLCEANCPADIYCFVDNAQKLVGSLSMCVSIRGFLLAKAKAMCFAFSPVGITKDGLAVHKFPFQCTHKVFFTPYTEAELAKYIAVKGITPSPDQVIQLKTSTLPRIVYTVLSSTRKVNIADELFVPFASIMISLTSTERLSQSLQETFVSAIMSGCTDKHHMLLYCGLVYENERQELKFVYPFDLMITYLQSTIANTYKLMLSFDTGSAMEFLFFATVLSHGFDIVCKGLKPQPVNDARNSRKKTMHIQCTKMCSQEEIPHGIQSECVLLVKLMKRHAAIDFLIFQNHAGAESKKLFFIQVSALKYQSRNSKKRISSVRNKCKDTNNQSPLEYFSAMCGVNQRECYYVYATPEVPIHGRYLKKKKDDVNHIYFAQLDPPSQYQKIVWNYKLRI